MKEWQTKNFSDVLDIKNGRNQKEVESDSGEYPIYGSAGNVMGYANSYICEAGTTIVGRKGNINSPIYSETRFWNVDTAFGLAAKPGLDSKFLYYYCISYDFSALNRGTTIPSLVKSELLGISIPFPPLPEQHRIVAILDAAFDHIATARANCEANLLNARAIFESHLQAVFTQRGDGWVEKPLNQICSIKHGFAFEGSDFSNSVEKGSPIVITPGNFTEDGKLLFNDKNTKRFSGVPLEAFRFTFGDLVVVMTDLSSKMKILGKPAFIETNNVLHNQRVGRVQFFDKSVQNRLVYYYMMSDKFLNGIKASATGTMVRHTAPTRILSSVMSYPCELEKQISVIKKLDTLKAETQHLASLYQRKLQALDDLKKSLLNQAFGGLL